MFMHPSGDIFFVGPEEHPDSEVLSQDTGFSRINSSNNTLDSIVES